MATLHCVPQIVEWRRLHSHRMHGDTDSLTEHAGWITHAARLVDHIGRRRALDDCMSIELATGAPVGKQGPQMHVGNQRPVERHRRARGDTDRLAAVHGDQYILDTRVGMVLGGGHGITDRLLGQFHADYGAGSDALAFTQSGADHPEAARLSSPDQAYCLRRADIQDRDKAGPVGRSLRPRSQFNRLTHYAAFPLGSFFFSPLRSTKKYCVAERKSISPMSRSRIAFSTMRKSRASRSFG